MKLELRPEQEDLFLKRQPLLPPSVCSPSHQKGRAGALLPQSSSRTMLKRQERCHDSRAEGSCTEPLSAGSRVTPALFPFTLCLLSALPAVSKQSAAAVWPDIPARGVEQAAALLCECTAKTPRPQRVRCSARATRQPRSLANDAEPLLSVLPAHGEFP